MLLCRLLVWLFAEVWPKTLPRQLPLKLALKWPRVEAMAMLGASGSVHAKPVLDIHASYFASVRKTDLYFADSFVDRSNAELWKQVRAFIVAEFRRISDELADSNDPADAKSKKLLDTDGYSCFKPEIGVRVFMISEEPHVQDPSKIVMLMMSFGGTDMCPWTKKESSWEGFRVCHGQRPDITRAFQNRPTHRTPCTIKERKYDGMSLLLHAYSAIVWSATKDTLFIRATPIMANIFSLAFGEKVVNEKTDKSLAVQVDTDAMIKYAKLQGLKEYGAGRRRNRDRDRRNATRDRDRDRSSELRSRSPNRDSRPIQYELKLAKRGQLSTGLLMACLILQESDAKKEAEIAVSR